MTVTKGAGASTVLLTIVREGIGKWGGRREEARC